MANINLDLFYQAGRALGRNVKAEKRTKQIQQVGKAVVDITNKIGEYKKQRQETTAKYLEDFPDDIKVADVDEYLRKPITNYLTEKKKEYNDLAIQAGKFPAGTEKGIEIREAMNDIKAGMSTVSKDLEFLKTTKIQAGANIRAGLSAGDEFDVDNTHIIASNDYDTLQLKIDDNGISYFNPQSTQRENITNLKILGADDKKGMNLQNELKVKYQGLGSNINFPFNEADARSDVENMFNSMSKEQQKNWFFSSGYADKLLQEKGFTFTPIDELREDQYDAEELNKIKQQNNSYEQEKLKLQFQDVYVNDFVINDLTDEVRDYFNANRSYVEQKQLEKENKALELAGKKADIEVKTFTEKQNILYSAKARYDEKLQAASDILKQGKTSSESIQETQRLLAERGLLPEGKNIDGIATREELEEYNKTITSLMKNMPVIDYLENPANRADEKYKAVYDKFIAENPSVKLNINETA